MKFQKGISLPEVMVAAVLLGLAILCISPMMSYGIKSTHINKERSAAVQAAQRLVEEIRHAGFASANSKVNPSTTSAIENDDLQGQKLYINGKGEVSTQASSSTKLLQVVRQYYFIANGPNTVDDLIRVNVRITWPGSGGKNVSMGVDLSRSMVQ